VLSWIRTREYRLSADKVARAQGYESLDIVRLKPSFFFASEHESGPLSHSFISPYFAVYMHMHTKPKEEHYQSKPKRQYRK